MRRSANTYGAGPVHLLAMALSFALIGYVITLAGPDTLFDTGSWWQSIAVWFLGAALAHDLVLLPLYSLADRALASGLRAIRGTRRARPSTQPAAVPVLNYLRLPLLGTGLTFLLFFPGIIEQGADTYLAATGQTQEPFLSRWLLLVAAMFALSAIAYAVRFTLTAAQAPAVGNAHLGAPAQ